MKKHLIRIFEIILLAALTVAICFADIKILKAVEKPLQEEVVASEEAEPIQQETPVISYEDTLKISSPKEQNLTVDVPTVEFVGVCDLQYTLTVNGNTVPLAEDGSFLYYADLKYGENVFVISNGVISYEYRITYKLKIINAVSPTGKLSVDGGMELTLSVEALKNSQVYATIGSSRIPMSVAAEGEPFDTYQATYTIPAAVGNAVNLGKITFVAENSGMQDRRTGASITVKPFSTSNITIETGRGTVVQPAVSEGGVVQVLSPNDDHQRGMATICCVNADYAETVPGNTANDNSDPEYTPLVKGTIDYVKSDCVYDGTEYFILLSGVKVEKKYVSAFNGYVMPTNTVSLYNGYTSGDHTDAVITMNWKVPFNSVLRNQAYYTGYSGRRFNVSSFTSNCIDFTFKYTNAAEGRLDFPSSSVVSGAEWINVGNDGTTTLRVHLKTPGKFYGYKAYYSSDNRLVLQFNEKPSSSGATVVLDPGHGGRDCGAIGVNGIYESHLNISLATMVKSNLEAMGYRVIMLRTGDSAISLEQRQALARSKGGDIFVSLHHNSSAGPALSGTEVYYYRAFSKPLASSIHNRLANEWRSVYSDNPTMYNKVVAQDGGVRYYPFRVTRIEECPAVLVECGYLSNATECELACNDGIRSRLAQEIAQGIADYFANA